MCALLAWDLSGECTESVMLQIPLTVPNKFLGMAHSDGWCRRTAHKHPRPQVQTPSNTNFYKDSFFIWSSASLLTEETWGQFHLCGRLHGVCFLLFSFLNQNKTNLTSQQVADILDLYDPSPVLLPPSSCCWTHLYYVRVHSCMVVCIVALLLVANNSAVAESRDPPCICLCLSVKSGPTKKESPGAVCPASFSVCPAGSVWAWRAYSVCPWMGGWVERLGELGRGWWVETSLKVLSFGFACA